MSKRKIKTHCVHEVEKLHSFLNFLDFEEFLLIFKIIITFRFALQSELFLLLWLLRLVWDKIAQGIKEDGSKILLSFNEDDDDDIVNNIPISSSGLAGGLLGVRGSSAPVIPPPVVAFKGAGEGDKRRGTIKNKQNKNKLLKKLEHEKNVVYIIYIIIIK